MRAYHSAAAPSRPFISAEIPPKTRPNPAIATVHPSSATRCSRQTSPNGLRSPCVASACPRRSARMPLPTSRVFASMLAAPTRTTKASPKRPERPPVVAAERPHLLPHPIGDSQVGHALTRRRPVASLWPSMFPRPLWKARTADGSAPAARISKAGACAARRRPNEVLTRAKEAKPAAHHPSSVVGVENQPPRKGW